MFVVFYIIFTFRNTGMETETSYSSQKAHRKRQAGSKLDKKKKKTPSDPNVSARQRNPKAFAYHSVNKVARQVRRFVVCFCMINLIVCFDSFLSCVFYVVYNTAIFGVLTWLMGTENRSVEQKPIAYLC